MRLGACAAWAAAAAVLLILVKLHGGPELVRSSLAWIDGLGAWGGAAFVLLYIVAAVLFVPGSLLTLGAGALFGVVRGSVAVSIASTLGASAAFLIGRYLARDWVARAIEGNETFRAIDGAVADEGFKIVALLRLSPAFPFNLLNYALGLTRVRFRDYFLASWLGMMPGTVLYAYIGSLAGDLALVGAGGRARTPGEWALYVAGLLATVAAAAYVTRLARAALRERVQR